MAAVRYVGARKFVYQSNLDTHSILDEYDHHTLVHDALHTDSVPDEVYVDKLEDLLTGTQFYGVPPSPTNIIHNVYLGTQANAENPDLLRRLKIKYVLNCGGLPESLRASRTAKFDKCGVYYDEIPADDSDNSDILMYFGRAHAFIERNRLSGRVLIYCPGVSRSGAIALSYLVRQGRRLLDAAKQLKNERRVVICIRGFLKQIVSFARVCGMLDPNVEDVKVPRYGRKLDRARIYSSHLPLV